MKVITKHGITFECAAKLPIQKKLEFLLSIAVAVEGYKEAEIPSTENRLDTLLDYLKFN